MAKKLAISEVNTFPKTAFVDRPKVSAEEMEAQKLPVLAADKIRDIARKFERGDLDVLAPQLAQSVSRG